MLHAVDGEQTVDEVFAAIEEALGKSPGVRLQPDPSSSLDSDSEKVVSP